MKLFTRLPFVALLLAVPCWALAADKKKNRRKQEAVQPARPAAEPAKPIQDPASPWHAWSDGQGHTLEAKFKALEYGLLSVEDRAGTMRRFPMTKLTPEDQQFANKCKELQPRVALATDVIEKAAARLDETVLAGLKRANQTPNAPASDETFARRLYLDVIGRIPTRVEITTFLADPAPDKRSKLVDSLLNSPGYTMQMFNYLADMLRVKDDYGKGAKAYVFEDWLKDMVAINRPWDAVVNDMLTADGKLMASGPAGFLLRDAQMPLDGVSNLLTTFLGADVSCAQCHDHPLADWSQKDFYQIAAFFGATDGYHEDVAKQIKKLGKSGEGKRIAQLLASNAYDLVDMKQNKLAFPKDYKYDNAKPGEKVTPALISWSDKDKQGPAYKVETKNPTELRNEFSKWMTSPDNPRFATAIANRIWRKAFGLAVQEPVSDLDDPRSASNPELLAQITVYMKQAKFDLREFQRILFNTAAYQRQACPTPDLGKGNFLFAGPLLRRLSAEQAWDSIMTLASGNDVDHSILRRGDELKLTAVDGQMNAEAAQEVKERLAKEGVNLNGGGGGGGKKKGPGINARALGQFYDGVRPQERAGLLLARASELPQPAPETHFLRVFGQSDRLVSDTNATDGSVPQVMSLMNGPVQQVATGAGSSALAEIDKLPTPPAKIEALYLSFLGRRPTTEEQQRMTAALTGGLGTADCAWALLNTREFLFVR